jgi:hypothetical protein
MDQVIFRQQVHGKFKIAAQASGIIVCDKKLSLKGMKLKGTRHPDEMFEQDLGQLRIGFVYNQSVERSSVWRCHFSQSSDAHDSSSSLGFSGLFNYEREGVRGVRANAS